MSAISRKYFHSPGRGLALLATILAGGCHPASPSERSQREPAANATLAAQEKPASTAASQIQLRIADAAEYRNLLRSHIGQVVLVDFWATWCGPCTELFPHVVALHAKHSSQGLAVISVSLDDPSEQPRVFQFLRDRQASFDNLLSKFGTGSESTAAFELRGDVPLYRLFDRAGHLRFQFSGDPSGLDSGEPLENLDRRVQELLAEPSALAE